MHHFLTNSQEKDIIDQLMAKGYPNAEAIVRDTAQEVFRGIDSVSKDGILMWDNARPSEVLHSFLFAKGEDDRYQHYLTRATYQWRSVALPDDILTIDKQYCISDSKIPDREAMENAVMARVRERNREDNLYVNRDISKEFFKLGFGELYFMLTNAKHHGNLTYLKTERELPSKALEELGAVKYEFVVVSPEQGRSPYIAMIKASLIDRPHQGGQSQNIEKVFSRRSGPLPTDKQMAALLLTGLEIAPKTFDRVRDMFKKTEQSRAGPDKNAQKHFRR